MSRRKEANAAARRIIARLRACPADGQMMIQSPGGYRVMPEEVWIEALGQWVKCDGWSISGGPTGYLYPGPIMRWRLTRLFEWWRDQVELPPICDHRRQSDTYWTQDGYTSQCRVCNQTVYHGD
ncbi:hypothetical protein [Sphingomonas phage Carli]|nr:hypothetical protein [Sphingomonas phage Carli]